MKISKIFGILFVCAACIIVITRFVGGRNSWICQNGQWVRHGYPIVGKPTAPCTQSRIKPDNFHMVFRSSVFTDKQALPTEYTCKGKGIRPPLSIAGVPAEAKSLAIIVDDPDAPLSIFHHWIIWNIPPKVSEISEHLPEGSVEGIHSAQKQGYFPPCPPSGTHRYIFTLYALDAMLTSRFSLNAESLLRAMEGHVITQDHITALVSK
jgi:Raf kinase inhibitor-like YbhB/YbcL family protein